MTSTPSREPTLTDVIVKIDNLSTGMDNLSVRVDHLSTDVEKLSVRVDHLSNDVEKLSTDVEKFNDRFTNYQQATQWVVQLAFTLIASATITVILTTVVRR